GEKLLQVFGIFLKRVGLIYEIERENFRVGQAHNHGAYRLRQCPTVYEVDVGEMRVPIEIIVDRMVDSAVVLAAIAQIQRGDSEVIKKGGVVGSRSESVDAEVRTIANFLALFRSFRLGDIVQLAPLPHG